MAQYQSVNGAARRVIGRYQGVSGAARRVTAGWVGVGGLARRYFTTGVRWRKWNCTVSTETGGYEQVDSDGVYTVGDRWSRTVSTNSVTWSTYSDYSFSSADGFTMNGYGTATPDTIVGRCQGGSDVVYRCVDCEDLGNGSYSLTWEYVGLAVFDTWKVYRKGENDLGTVYAEEGMLPEDGSCLDGSAAEGWCVLVSEGVHYYYEREE